MNELTHLSLFSGIGGLDLAAEWAGFRTVGQCEWADYPRAVLEKHWPGLPRWRDVCTLDTNNTPKIHRIRLKAKKFVYYKLIFRVESEGATATVLSYDQKIRFGSMAK